jgi:glutaconate CoA-transferase, subunit B
MENDHSISELMAVHLARQLNDGEVLRVGVASPVPEAAVRLAHLTHGPNMDLVFLGARMNVAHLETIPMPAYGWDRRVVRWAESFSDTGHRFDRVKDWKNHVFFIGGVQVDAYGNTNLIGVGPDYRQLKFRGPGSVGTPTLSTHVGRYYIVLNSHNPRILTAKCDYISAFGWGTGGADARSKLGIPGGGPEQCITPLCVFDFADDTKRMRLASVHPGVSVAQVKRETGFDFIIPEAVRVTEAPDTDELNALRTRVDLAGRLRA